MKYKYVSFILSAKKKTSSTRASHIALPLGGGSNGTNAPEGSGELIEIKQKLLMSRLLYPNPVCILTTPEHPEHPEHAYANAMTISWLSMVNNNGLAMFSMNKRHIRP